jgi:hypothetical protein
MAKRLTKKETPFETALRITKLLKSDEDWIIDSNSFGSTLNSIDVFNLVYVALSAKEDNGDC